MMREQRVIAFIAKLLDQGVDSETIARAIDAVLDIKLGESITSLGRDNDELIRAFCMEQASRLEKG